MATGEQPDGDWAVEDERRRGGGWGRRTDASRGFRAKGNTMTYRWNSDERIQNIFHMISSSHHALS
jgi:hypothetical protein